MDEKSNDQNPEPVAEANAPEKENQLVKPDAPPEETVVSDGTEAEASEAAPKTNLWQHYLAKKKLTFPATIVVLVLILLALPFTRYPVLGLFMKQSVDVVVQDGSTNQPVSNADVSLHGVTTQTDANGKASLHVKLGKAALTIHKAYYKDYSQTVMVGLSKANAITVSLGATGRQVPVTVNNKITGKPLSGVHVSAEQSQVTTDSKGKAIIVLPAEKKTVDAKLTLNGYNEGKASITVTEKDDANVLSITPSGHIYFLSKASGKIDVVRTNLDGSGRKTVLGGTGSEDDRDTTLLASKDWKYLALKSRRSGKLAKLYAINTANDKLTTMDEGNADFTLDGWVGHRFVYTVTRNDWLVYKPGNAALKSYDADSGQLRTLDQTSAVGNANVYALESFGSVYPLKSVVVYDKSWTTSYPSTHYVQSKSNTINSVNPDGSGKRVLKSFKAYDSANDSTFSLLAQAYDSGGILYSYGGSPSVYKYENGQVTVDSSVSQDDFNNKTYPTYLLSPDDKFTFWGDDRDGKTTLFVGNTDGEHGKQIAALSEYSPFGWYTDEYLLVSKNSDELYIMSVKGGHALKISDYHKPSTRFYGYGGGYGGL